MCAFKNEIWSDFVCPRCYIGKRRFELDPAAPADDPQPADVFLETLEAS